MASNCNSSNSKVLNCNSSNNKAECRQESEGNYLVVDHGEKILLDVEETRLELQRQILSLLEKICLLWDVVRKSLIFMLPVLAGITICLITGSCLPSSVAMLISTLVFGIVIGLIFINLSPLNESIAQFLDHEMYVPTIQSNERTRFLREKNLSENANSEAEEAILPQNPFEDATLPESGKVGVQSQGKKGPQCDLALD